MRNIKSENLKLDEDSHEYDSLIILISIVGVAIGFLNAILPMQTINSKLFSIKEHKAKALNITYD